MNVSAVSYGNDFSPGIEDDGSGGGCTNPRKPFAAQDGIEVYAAKKNGGGTITCPEGTHPNVETDGKKVVVTCGDDAPFRAPVLW
jgi:hypothetical protein